MDDAAEQAASTATERVLERLRRIKQLDHDASPGRLLDELRELVGEAEEWAKLDGDDRARQASSRLDEAVAALEGVAPHELIVR
jgi:hypothetical protein